MTNPERGSFSLRVMSNRSEHSYGSFCGREATARPRRCWRKNWWRGSFHPRRRRCPQHRFLRPLSPPPFSLPPSLLPLWRKQGGCASATPDRRCAYGGRTKRASAAATVRWCWIRRRSCGSRPTYNPMTSSTTSAQALASIRLSPAPTGTRWWLRLSPGMRPSSDCASTWCSTTAGEA